MRSILRLFRRHPLVRLFVLQALIGFAISSIFVGGLVLFDVGGFSTMTRSQHSDAVVLLLWFFVGLTFASVQMGMAIMSLKPEPPPGGGKKVRVDTLQPVPVKSR
ncbi:hypothetical protein [Terricaulis sp.]|uniref:hypothetical protein n=1 Tax=Terricaulis sp. TaxID=2768686 RepID=UPI0037830AEF